MLNQCNFIGRVGQDPEVRYTQDGSAVANISLACTETWKKDGQKQERTEWVRVTFFGKLAEIVGQYVQKGSLLYVSGKLTTRKYQDRDGNDRYSTEIRASEMKILGGGSGAGGQEKAASSQNTATGYGFDDDMPF